MEFEAKTLINLVETALADHEEVAQWECRQKPYEHPKHYSPVTGDTLWCSSACTLFRTSALRKVGGYEHRLFMYGEDVELSYRLRDHGYRLRYIPKATVWHYTYEEAAQVKPMQFLGSTYANVLLRCRYGRWRQVFTGFAMYMGLLTLPQSFAGQRLGFACAGAAAAWLLAFKMEKLHQRLQLIRLRAHFFGGGGQFFRGRRILLGGLVQLAHGIVDLGDTGRLLLAGGSDFLDEIGRLLDAGHHHGGGQRINLLPDRYSLLEVYRHLTGA